jgi:threonine/homoserine/homoserine lactone efflux protein
VTFAPIAGFSLAAGLLTITPGLDTALLLRTAAVEGSHRARLVAAGICSGCLIWGASTALGLTALLAVSRFAYDVLRAAGAGYLIYLGLQMFLHSRKFGAGLDAAPDGIVPARVSPGRWFQRGLLSNLLNPKVGVFYVTLLPQFIPAGANVTQYSFLLALIHVTEGLIWLTLLTLAVRPLRAWLQRPVVTRSLDRTTGLVLVCSGVALALERRRL